MAMYSFTTAMFFWGGISTVGFWRMRSGVRAKDLFLFILGS